MSDKLVIVLVFLCNFTRFVLFK